MKKLLILGASISQFPTIGITRKLGHYSVVVDGSPNALYKDLSDKFIVADIKDHFKVLEVARAEKVDGIVCPGSDFPFTAAYVAKKMGLPGLDPDVAAICQNKYEQRKLLREKRYFVPNFALIKNRNELDNVHSLKFPIVMKPVDNMSARGTKVISVHYEAELWYEKALQYSRSSQVIAEEFMPGMEFSIDYLCEETDFAAGWHIGKVYAFADRHFMLYPWLIENGHTCPSILGKWDQNVINETFRKAVDDLGINFGAAKGDIKLTENGVMICEIAARISGGFLSGWTYPFTSGINQHYNLVRAHLGEPLISQEEQAYGYSAERVLMSIPGQIKSIINKEKLMPNILYVHLHVHEGSDVNFPYNNACRCGSVLSFCQDRHKAIYMAQLGAASIILRLEPDNPETKKWLDMPMGFQMFVPGAKETDWHDTDIEKALRVICEITKLPMTQVIRAKNFWKYFYKGGIQGGLFAVDSN